MVNINSIRSASIPVLGLIVMLASGMLNCAQAGEAVKAPMPPAIEGELLVKFSARMKKEDIDALGRGLGVKSENVSQDGLLRRIAVDNPKRLKDIRKIYEMIPGVEYAEPNYVNQIMPVMPVKPNTDIITVVPKTPVTASSKAAGKAMMKKDATIQKDKTTKPCAVKLEALKPPKAE